MHPRNFVHYSFQTGKGQFRRLPKQTHRVSPGYLMLQDQGGIIWDDNEPCEEVPIGCP